MYEPSGEAPNHNSPNPNQSADHIPPDPLLEPGTFIDGNLNDPDTTAAAAANHSEPSLTGSPKLRGEERTRPLSDFSTATTVDTPPSRRQKRATEETAGTIPSGIMERPDWLPDGWRLDVRVRSSGATAGTTDRYYIEPTNGHRFRSKKEVLYFLETGEKMKKRPNPDEGDATPSTGGKEKKEKKSETKAKKPVPINFDFNHPPETVSWSLKDIAADQWDPSVGDQKVAESTKKEWATVFNRICELQSQNSGS